MSDICKAFSHPEKAFPAIHVAGTNGKGSTCTKIAKALSLSGHRVGLYTSPHISTPRERISVQDELISEESFSRIFSEVFSLFPKCSFFEMLTAIAFIYFKEKGVDVAVLETGLGGTFDPTNICTPILSIITSIGYDHVDILGNSLSSIAKAKAGIIKKRVPVLLGKSAALQEILDTAHRFSSPLHFSFSASSDYEKYNSALAEKALHLIDPLFPTSLQNKLSGTKAQPPCRFEIVEENPLLILDAAHNKEGLYSLLQKVEENYPRRCYKLLLAFSKGKDLSGYPKLFSPEKHEIYLLDSPDSKLEKASVIAKLFTFPVSTVSDVHSFRKKSTGSDDVLVIAGSFFLMEKAKKFLALPPTP